MKPLMQKLFSLGLAVSGKKALKHILNGTDDPEKTQEKTLLNILKAHASTDLGKKLGLSGIESIQEFQRRVPIMEYEDIRPFVEASMDGKPNAVVKGLPDFYASTSGSTGKPKYIPISSFTEEVTNKAFSKASAYLIYKGCPEAFSGKILHITSPVVEEFAPGGAAIGSATGNVMKNANRVVRSMYALPPEIYGISDAEAKYYAILLYSLDQNISMMMTANPSTFLLLGKKLEEWQDSLIQDLESGVCSNPNVPLAITQKLKRAPNPRRAEVLRQCIASDPERKLRPSQVWKNLKVLGCWTGGNCANYLSRLPAYYGQVSIKDPGYVASELRGSMPLRLNDPSGVLSINDNFYEFIKVEDIDESQPRIYLAHELEKGQQYYIIITNYCGLYRYNIHDIVEVTGFCNSTPEIVFVQKGKGITSISGEKLYEQQLISAVSEVSRKLKVELSFYLAFANVAASRYDLFVETSGGGSPLCENFAREVDAQLQAINMEYRSKRTTMRLHPIEIQVTLPNAYERFKAWRVSQGIRETQYKMVYLTQDHSMLHPIRSVAPAVSVK
ncbi:GH3 auxin-responsive promoter family protein [Oligoflexus tunisiensis]|uniref:GH3 auxin-responsive promoter family protein n=1 Tax=Oligoflexus tunisiensis TaxID=708132 RepID=UPI00114CC463|nr:GH3 auxin-responsive promoter family protein [Oligoflexus tunisiensis]